MEGDKHNKRTSSRRKKSNQKNELAGILLFFEKENRKREKRKEKRKDINWQDGKKQKARGGDKWGASETTKKTKAHRCSAKKKKKTKKQKINVSYGGEIGGKTSGEGERKKKKRKGNIETSYEGGAGGSGLKSRFLSANHIKAQSLRNSDSFNNMYRLLCYAMARLRRLVCKFMLDYRRSTHPVISRNNYHRNGTKMEKKIPPSPEGDGRSSAGVFKRPKTLYRLPTCLRGSPYAPSSARPESFLSGLYNYEQPMGSGNVSRGIYTRADISALRETRAQRIRRTKSIDETKQKKHSSEKKGSVVVDEICLPTGEREKIASVSPTSTAEPFFGRERGRKEEWAEEEELD